MRKLTKEALLRRALLCSACITTALIAPPASAQDMVETVVVTGIRGSLERSMDIKREALGLTDAITMEDIGKFPDSNLAQAMMRIPGVTITRGTTSSGGVTSSTGEATQITVRGFGPVYNETMVEGRKVPAAIANRGFDFSSLNSDMVQQISVLKTPDPSLSSGAIGATVNIKYPKPLDKPGLRVAASASATISPEAGAFTPNGNFIVSDTFAGDKVGVLLSGSYTESKIRVHQVSNWGWGGVTIADCQLTPTCTDAELANVNESRPVWFSQDLGLYVMRDWVMREEVRGVVQLKPADSLLITLDADFYRSERKEDQSTTAIWNVKDQMRGVQLSENGTVLSFFRKPGNAELQVPTDFNGYVADVVMQGHSVGANVKWNVNDKWTFIADLATAAAALSPDGQYTGANADVGYGPNTPGAINGSNLGNVNAASGHALPYFLNYGPNGDPDQFTNPNIIGSHVMILGSARTRNSTSQAKLETKFDDEKLQFTAGVSWVANHLKSETWDTFSNNQWQTFAGYGPGSRNYFTAGDIQGAIASGAATPASLVAALSGLPASTLLNGTGGVPNLPKGVALPASFFSKTYKIGKDFIPGWSGGENLPPQIFAINTFQILNYLEGLGDPTQTVVPGFNYAYNWQPNYKGLLRPARNGGTVFGNFEDVWSGYMAATIKSEFYGMPLTTAVGLRAEYTRVKTTAVSQVPLSIDISATDPSNAVVTLSSPVPVSATNNYLYWLPNLDLNLQVTDTFHVRVDLSRSLTRPPLLFGTQNPLSPTSTVPVAERQGTLTANAGNPKLRPYLSDNFDISGQWYYEADSYLSADVFLKRSHNFLIGGTVVRPINDVIDPWTHQIAQFNVNSLVNGPSANIYGLEVAWQHMFGDTGLGYILNGTLVQTDKPYNPHDTSVSAFAVTGLADSANMTLFYDKDGFEIRAALNWVDTSLARFGQYQNPGKFGAEPYFVNANWSLDLSSRYDITDYLTVYGEVQNLLNSSYSSRGRFSEQVLDVTSYGRRATVGLHYKL